MKIIYFDTENPFVNEDYGREEEEDVVSDDGPTVMGYEVTVDQQSYEHEDTMEKWVVQKFGESPDDWMPWIRKWWPAGRNFDDKTVTYFFKKRGDATLFELTFG